MNKSKSMSRLDKSKSQFKINSDKYGTIKKVYNMMKYYQNNQMIDPEKYNLLQVTKRDTNYYHRAQI